MARKRNRTSSDVSNRKAGVYIEGSHVNVGGDLVGRDKVTIGSDDRGLDGLFEELAIAIRHTDNLSPDEKKQLTAAGNQLRTELKKDEPDLGVIGRLKGLLQSSGGTVATAAAAIFQYPPVQDAIKAVTQRLLGA
jgi:hypothetical protein